MELAKISLRTLRNWFVDEGPFDIRLTRNTVVSTIQGPILTCLGTRSLNHTTEHQEKVIFSDEYKFNL